MKKQEIAVRVDWERFLQALRERGVSQTALAVKAGMNNQYFQKWYRQRGGFLREVVAFLNKEGITPGEYEGEAKEDAPSSAEIEDAFVRALERFYGVAEGEYGQWFITTMNAEAKNACREVLHGSEV